MNANTRKPRSKGPRRPRGKPEKKARTPVSGPRGGLTTDTPHGVRVTVYMPRELWNLARKAAIDANLTTSKYIVRVVEEALGEEEDKP
jgi:hypothetical protein